MKENPFPPLDAFHCFQSVKIFIANLKSQSHHLSSLSFHSLASLPNEKPYYFIFIANRKYERRDVSLVLFFFIFHSYKFSQFIRDRKISNQINPGVVIN